MTAAELAAQRSQQWKRVGGTVARWPAHDDDRASLSIGTADDGGVLLYCHAGCSPYDALPAAGLTFADLHDGRNSALPAIIAEYDYRDESGILKFQVIRRAPKTFRQRRPDDGGALPVVRLPRRDGAVRRLLFDKEDLIALISRAKEFDR